MLSSLGKRKGVSALLIPVTYSTFLQIILFCKHFLLFSYFRQEEKNLLVWFLYTVQVDRCKKMFEESQPQLEYIHSLQDTLIAHFRIINTEEVALEENVN